MRKLGATVALTLLVVGPFPGPAAAEWLVSPYASSLGKVAVTL